MSSRRTLCRVAARGALMALILSGGALAGPAGTQGSDFVYEVEPGDTLIGLAARYMTSPDGWRLLQARNHVPDPYRLVPGSHIRIPLAQIPVAQATARVVFLRGQVRVDGKPAQSGATLGESAQIETGPDSSVTLELADGSRVALPASTTVRVRRLRTFARSGLTDAVIGIERGGADSRVAPHGGGVGRFEIRTPLMVTGVRGTRYRVSADDAGSRSEVVEGRVGAGTATGPATHVAAGFGIGVSPAGKLSKPSALLPAPPIAALPQPVMGRSVTIHWQPVPGAVGYRVGVARDPALTEWVSTGDVAAPEAVLNDLPDGPLLLAVSALSADHLMGIAGVQPFTVRRNPAAPFSLAPQPDATVHGGAVEFRWAAVQDASGYELALAGDSAFSQTVDVRREDAVEARRTLPVGQWWWRLRSLDAQDRPGPWSDALQLTVQPEPPVPAPVDGGGVLRVHWPADAAGGAAAGYVLQMAADSGFEAGLVTLRTTESMVAIPRPAQGTYFIRVAREDGDAMPPVQAFSPPQRIDIRAVLLDGLGGVVVMGGEEKGVQIGPQ